jgi:hypothetical protein
MPLRKLWNSIRGKSAAPAEPVGRSQEPSTPREGVETAARPVAACRPAAEVKSFKNAASREDKKLFRRIESMSIASVLEVTIGDGARSLSMLQTLTHKGHSTPLHYLAIDEFEMGGNELSLRAFHQQLREFPAKAHLVPMPIDAGLDRVVRTFGQVDLIIWANQQPPTDHQLKAIVRLSKPGAIMFSQQGGRWSEARCGLMAGQRAA